MPSRQEYGEQIQKILEPHLVKPDLAWQGLYQLLLWYTHGVPHIIDGDKLVSGPWRDRAKLIENALAIEFNCSISDVPDKVDQLLRSPIFPKPPQRQNPLGIGFVEGLFQILRRFCADRFQFYPEGAIGRSVFSGITNPPRSKPDIVVARQGLEVALISAKWSLRHDRLKDILDECEYFTRIHGSLRFYAITNEFDPARLGRLASSRCIDKVFHVKKPLLQVAGLDGRVDAIGDLEDLLQTFQ